MEQARIMELDALEREFDSLCKRWAVSSDERQSLLGLERESERSKRVMLEIDRHMRMMIGEDEVTSWLRDSGETGLSPLAFMSIGRDERLAMLAAARQRFLERFPQDL